MTFQTFFSLNVIYFFTFSVSKWMSLIFIFKLSNWIKSVEETIKIKKKKIWLINYDKVSLYKDVIFKKIRKFVLLDKFFFKLAFMNIFVKIFKAMKSFITFHSHFAIQQLKWIIIIIIIIISVLFLNILCVGKSYKVLKSNSQEIVSKLFKLLYHIWT